MITRACLEVCPGSLCIPCSRNYKSILYNKFLQAERKGVLMKVNGLTESEKVTMKCVWDLGDGARLAHIMEVANGKYKKTWKPQTVSTFLGKLVKKGYIEQYRDGRYFYYHILVSRHDYRCKMLRDDLEFWNDCDTEEFAQELMDKETFSEEQRREIAEAIGKLL